MIDLRKYNAKTKNYLELDHVALNKLGERVTWFENSTAPAAMEISQGANVNIPRHLTEEQTMELAPNPTLMTTMTVIQTNNKVK